MSNRHQELTSPEQTATGKDFPNPLIVDSLLKTIWSSMHHVFTMKHWLVQSKRLLHNMVAFLEKSSGSAGFHQIIDFLNRSHICYALTKKPEVCVSFIRQFWRTAETLTDDNGEGIRKETQFQQHTRTYHVPSLSMKVFSNTKRPTKGFSGQEVALFPTMLDDPEPSTSPSRLEVKKLESQIKIGKARKQARVVLSDDEAFADDSSKQERKLFDEEVQEKASTDTELFIQEKDTTAEEVPIVSTAELDISTAGGTVTYLPKQEEYDQIFEDSKGNFKISDFKGMSYNDIRPIFEKIWDFNQNIEPMDTDHGSGKQKSPQKSPEKSPAKEKSPEKVVEEEIDTQEELTEGVKEPGAKRKKSIPRKSTRKRQKLEEDAEDKINSKGYFWIYLVVEELYRLVKNRYSASSPEGFDLMLWGDLHTLFEPDEEDEIWKDQHEYKLLSWRLCDFCGIHILLMENGYFVYKISSSEVTELFERIISRERRLEEFIQKKLDDLKDNHKFRGGLLGINLHMT
ncbi:hypothetical protein Tco_1090030 [Tanacetum coccineum]|uniref:Uncharacterized protein n=1 Tax=Tanacetum coccineum TaxID=301880 RepID=A0ABQ5I4N3_9ASTR